MKKFLRIFFLFCLTWASSVSLMAQDWNQIIKTAASDRMTAVGSRSVNDNYGYSVSVDDNYAVVGAYKSGVIASEGGAAYILYNNAGTWQTVKQLYPFDGSTFDNFGYSVSISGNYVVVGAYNEDHDAAGANYLSGAGSAYIFAKDQGGTDNWGLVKKVVASDRAASDNFGYSVSISGSNIVVGAYREDEDASGINNLSNSGSAYIFAKDQGGTENWGQVKKIVALDRAASDYFGWSVSISDNFVIVGAYYDDHDANGSTALNNSGSVYLFAKDQGGTDTWGQVKKIVASDREVSDNFGYSVSISGTQFIVGAWSEDHDAAGINRITDAGSAYLFAKDQGGTNNWGQVKKIVASDRAMYDVFGRSVSISGNYVIVGADYEDEDATGANTLGAAGSAYIFGKDQGGTNNWGQVKKIVAADREAGGVFGYSVSISGNNVIVGAYGEDHDAGGANTLSNAGSAYLYTIDQGGANNWGQTTKTVTEGSKINTNNRYGNSVAIDGDYAVVGANYEVKDVSGTNVLAGAGAAYILKYNGTTWTEIKKIVASDRAAGDNFGNSVSISGNFVIVGAPNESEDATGANTILGAGSAYIFAKDQGGTDNWGQVKKVVASDRGADDKFGWSLSISGNYVVVGAFYEDHDATGANTFANAGSAYIFAKDQGGTDNWGEVKKIVASDRAQSDSFGTTVSISGNYVIVGANNEDEDASGATTLSYAGSAYIFAKDQGGTDNWGQAKKIVASDRSAMDFFGSSVSISGNYAIVGAWNEADDAAGANPISGAGSAYIFAKDQGGADAWGQVKKIVASDRAVSDYFGTAVYISGSYVMVGAASEDEDALGANTLSNAGSAYIFAKDQGGTDTWGQVKKIVASDRATDDNFGVSVAISGTNAIVGSYWDDKDALGGNMVSDAGSAYIFAPLPITWDGSESNDWNTAGNWSGNAVPNASSNVTIPPATNAPVVNEALATPAICNNLTINAGGLVSINPGKALTVNGTLTNNAGITGLLINSGGSLIQNSTAVAATVKRTIAGDNKFHLFISPINESVVANGTSCFNGAYVDRYQESDGEWVRLATGDNVVSTYGYSVNFASGSPELTFPGTLKASPASYTNLSNTPAATGYDPGWNLAGNPYPCGINTALLTAPTGMNAIAYVWDETVSGNYTPLTIGAASATPGIIAPMQGFFVNTSSATNSLTLANAAKVHGGTFYKSGNSIPQMLTLSIAGNNYSDKTYVRFDQAATENFDQALDAYKLSGLDEAPQLYSMLPGEKAAINTLPATGSSQDVSLGLKVGAVATYTINVEGVNSFNPDLPIYFDDLKTGSSLDLRKQTTYTFIAGPADAENRFKLRFASTAGVGDQSRDNAHIYAGNGLIYINCNETSAGTVYLYSVSGQLLAISNLNAGETTIPSPASGVYLVKVVSEKSAFTRKIAVVN